MSLAQGVLRKQLTSLGHIGLFHFDRLPGRFVYGFGNWFTEKRQRKESAEKNWQNDSRQAVSHRKNKPRWKFEAGMKSDVHLTQHFLAHQCCLSVRWNHLAILPLEAPQMYFPDTERGNLTFDFSALKIIHHGWFIHSGVQTVNLQFNLNYVDLANKYRKCIPQGFTMTLAPYNMCGLACQSIVWKSLVRVNTQRGVSFSFHSPLTAR